MYEDVYDYEEDYFTEEELIGLRACLSEEYQEAGEQELVELFENVLARMTLEEGRRFRRGLARFGRSLARVGSQLLPVIGTAVGSFGGPVGTVLGRRVGNIGGQLLGTVAQRGSRTTATVGARGQRPAVSTGTTPTGSTPPSTTVPSVPATSQLLQLLQSPQLSQLLQQALSSLRLGGSMGRRSIPVGNRESLTSAPPGAFLNLLSSLANQAAVEAAQIQTDEPIPAYLEGTEIDLANPDERARVLWERLQDSEDFQLSRGFYEAGDENMYEAYAEEYDDELVPIYEAFEDEGGVEDEDESLLYEELDGDLGERRIRRRRPRFRRIRMRPRRYRRPSGYYIRRRPRRDRRHPLTIVRRYREDYDALDWLADAGLIEEEIPYEPEAVWET